MRKVNLLIRGKLICKEILLGGGKSDLIAYADEKCYDVQNAIVIEGDVSVGRLVCNGLVAVTGEVAYRKEESQYGGNS